MAIPESQLEVWSNQGATVTAKATHESIRNALTHQLSPIAQRVASGSVTIYLQGSYKNDTNIRGDSDVDLVVELGTTFGNNAHQLPSEQKASHDMHYSGATYDWPEFRGDVVKALESYFGSSKVDANGNKSIKLLPVPGRLKADVVPVLNYRHYEYFVSPQQYQAHEGIKMYHRTSGSPIINFPQQHYDNGVLKNSKMSTDGRFKPAVRMFKNARSYLIDKNLLAKEKAPSYFLQSLIYNVPDSCFGTNCQTTFRSVLEHLYTNPIDNFFCQNGLLPLFGTSPEQWNRDDAVATILALVHLWDNWPNI